MLTSRLDAEGLDGSEGLLLPNNIMRPPPSPDDELYALYMLATYTEYGVRWAKRPKDSERIGLAEINELWKMCLASNDERGEFLRVVNRNIEGLKKTQKAGKHDVERWIAENEDAATSNRLSPAERQVLREQQDMLEDESDLDIDFVIDNIQETEFSKTNREFAAAGLATYMDTFRDVMPQINPTTSHRIEINKLTKHSEMPSFKKAPCIMPAITNANGEVAISNPTYVGDKYEAHKKEYLLKLRERNKSSKRATNSTGVLRAAEDTPPNAKRRRFIDPLAKQECRAELS